jgi:hypothetical protein
LLASGGDSAVAVEPGAVAVVSAGYLAAADTYATSGGE